MTISLFVTTNTVSPRHEFAIQLLESLAFGDDALQLKDVQHVLGAELYDVIVDGL